MITFKIKGRVYPDIINPKEAIAKRTEQDLKRKPNTYYCVECERYHLIYSNIGNDHRDYKEVK